MFINSKPKTTKPKSDQEDDGNHAIGILTNAVANWTAIVNRFALATLGFRTVNLLNILDV